MKNRQLTSWAFRNPNGGRSSVWILINCWLTLISDPHLKVRSLCKTAGGRRRVRWRRHATPAGRTRRTEEACGTTPAPRAAAPPGVRAATGAGGKATRGRRPAARRVKHREYLSGVRGRITGSRLQFFSVSSGEALLWFLQAPLKAAGDSWMSPINRQFSNMGILVRLETNDPITAKSKFYIQTELQTRMFQDFMWQTDRHRVGQTMELNGFTEILL